jgi:hypothetical protein
MWQVAPTFRRGPEILQEGIERTSCGFPAQSPQGGVSKPEICQVSLRANAHRDYEPGFDPIHRRVWSWRIPTYAEAQTLFTQAENWSNSPPDSKSPLARLRSLGVNQLKDNDDLWLRDKFTTTSYAPFNRRSIDARVLRLAPKGPILVDPQRVAEDCTTAVVPSCGKIFDTGRFILWLRDTTPGERASHW